MSDVDWRLLPALLASAVMTAFGVGALVKPTALEPLGVRAVSPLGSSEIRAVFGGMFIALGVSAVVLREPIVFLVLGIAWFGDVLARLAAVALDRVPAREAVPVLGIALAIGSALVSGYWLA